MAPAKALNVTLGIPTYNRGAILLRTLERIFTLDPAPAAILVVDQTREHPAEVERQLAAWSGEERIEWLRLTLPSIPHAMNEAMQRATTELVLYLDDDVDPVTDIVAAHAAAYADPGVWAVVGQCLEPGETAAHLTGPWDDRGLPDLDFRWNHDEARDVQNIIAMNLSVRRERALATGGFDENFVTAAYRFESDFALRIGQAGGRIRFEPRASVRHLRIPTGGTRSYGDHKTSAHPAHSAGDYYFALHHARSFPTYVAVRLRKNVLTRFHLRHPWTVPAKLIGELRGLLLARRLARGGRRLLR
jgi:GT2 family glycosyltransferase